jgi:hypothetical protein
MLHAGRGLQGRHCGLRHGGGWVGGCFFGDVCLTPPTPTPTRPPTPGGVGDGWEGGGGGGGLQSGWCCIWCLIQLFVCCLSQRMYPCMPRLPVFCPLPQHGNTDHSLCAIAAAVCTGLTWAADLMKG